MLVSGNWLKFAHKVFGILYMRAEEIVAWKS